MKDLYANGGKSPSFEDAVRLMIAGEITRNCVYPMMYSMKQLSTDIYRTAMMEADGRGKQKWESAGTKKRKISYLLYLTEKKHR